MSKRTADIRIGVSGWTYPPWRGHFYPEGLRQRDELRYAASVFNAIEVNGTFYGMQTPRSFAQWSEATPEDFVFAVKGSRYLTHLLRLREPETPLANFFASGPLKLGPKLGPILWQFPPNFKFEPLRIEPFLRLLPHDTGQARKLAHRHDQRLKAPAFYGRGPVRPVRHAMEIRHESFRDAAFIEMLRHYGVALVCADTVDWPRLMDLTSDFVYCRLHGSTELYRSAYSDKELDRWAARVRTWTAGKRMTDGEFAAAPERSTRPRDVFVFFDNTDKRKAPGNAQGLMQRLGMDTAAERHAA